VWAYESQADIIARGLNIDPVAFRLKNALRDGRPHATGTIVQNAKVVECVESVAAQLGWDEPFDRGTGIVRRGRGIAVGMKASISPTTSVAIVTVAADGSCTIAISTVDKGQGSDTAMAQIAAETLGITTESIAVVHSDTDTTPYDMATLGSRSTYHMGNAVLLAADDARRQLLALAATGLGVSAEACVCEDGAISTSDGRSMTFKELFVARFGMQAGSIVGSGAFEPPYVKPDVKTGQSSNITPFWMVCAAGVEISVDMETGRITVDRLVIAGDVGRAINPAIVVRQLNGGALMAIGSSLSEVMVFENGQVVNASLADYKIPSFLDVPPEIHTELIQDPHPNGPYGAKGAGESGTFAPAPAIANALHDAIGVRVREMPLLPERVLRAIREAAGTPLENE
jgi:CO/xanthine dehydrogenase Mo-binding subunit